MVHTNQRCRAPRLVLSAKSVFSGQLLHPATHVPWSLAGTVSGSPGGAVLSRAFARRGPAVRPAEGPCPACPVRRSAHSFACAGGFVSAPSVTPTCPHVSVISRALVAFERLASDSKQGLPLFAQHFPLDLVLFSHPAPPPQLASAPFSSPFSSPLLAPATHKKVLADCPSLPGHLPLLTSALTA